MKKTVVTLAAAFTLSTGLFATSGEAAEHTVQKGDTLWDLSQKYNTSVEKLMRDNSLSSSIILPNDTLQISESTTGSKEQASTYVVRSGDTLADIARAYGVSIGQLVSWNQLTSEDMIFVGDTLALSKASAGMAKVTKVAAPSVPVQQSQQAQPKQQVVTASQPTSSVARTITMEATAYTAYCTGCSGVTANGTDLRANPGLKVIAVDPSVIPLGTKVWVEGYGEAIAADTGGAIKGNKIDVFIPSKDQAYAWGRKSVTVKILN